MSVSTGFPTLQPCNRKNGLKSGKTGGNRHLCAQLLSQFVEQPVQILVVLTSLFNLVHGMQDGGVVLAAELASYFGERRFREVLGQIHGNLARVDDGA